MNERAASGMDTHTLHGCSRIGEEEGGREVGGERRGEGEEEGGEEGVCEREGVKKLVRGREG